MRLINSTDRNKGKKELAENIDSVENSLNRGGGEDFDLAVNLVRRGMNFIVYRVGNKLHFAPSRFLGYYRNTPSKQQRNPIKNGRDTSPIISKTMCGKYGQWRKNERLVDLHRKYCKSLGAEPCKHKKAFIFWDKSAESFFAKQCKARESK